MDDTNHPTRRKTPADEQLPDEVERALDRAILEAVNNQLPCGRLWIVGPKDGVFVPCVLHELSDKTKGSA